MTYLHDEQHRDTTKQITKKLVHLAVQGHEPPVGCVRAAAI